MTPTEQLPGPSVVKVKTMKPGISFHQFQTIMYFEAWTILSRETLGMESTTTVLAAR